MSDMALRIYVANDPVYVENGMILYLREGGPCWIIDPGLPPEAEHIVKHVREKSLDPTAILCTHGHADHIAGLDAVREELGPVPVHLAREEWPALTDPRENLSGMMSTGLITNVRDPRDLAPDSTMELDGTVWRILDTSGHSPGGRSFYCEELGIVITGDALFNDRAGDFHTRKKFRGMKEPRQDNNVPFAENTEYHQG